MQALLEGGHEALLAALQGLLVAHPILEAVEDPGDAGAQRLDGGDGLGKRLQVHAGAQRPVRHLGRRSGPAAPPRCTLGNVVLMCVRGWLWIATKRFF